MKIESISPEAEEEDLRRLKVKEQGKKGQGKTLGHQECPQGGEAS